MVARTASLTDTVGITNDLRVSIAPIPWAFYTVTKPDTLGDPSYSPDGTYLIFTEKIGSDYRIATLSLGATQAHTVVHNGTNPYGNPTIDASGFFILFSEQYTAPGGGYPYGQSSLKYMNLDGTNVTTILDDGNANLNPVWVTPTQIAFQWWSDGATPSSAFWVSLIDLAGQGRVDIGEGDYPRTVVQ